MFNGFPKQFPMLTNFLNGRHFQELHGGAKYEVGADFQDQGGTLQGDQRASSECVEAGEPPGEVQVADREALREEGGDVGEGAADASRRHEVPRQQGQAGTQGRAHGPKAPVQDLLGQPPSSEGEQGKR